MLCVGFPAAAFGTNCYVLADAAGQECLIVDPGIGVLQPLQDVLVEHKLKPAAVLLTHGHVDHVFSVTPVCGTQGIPALIHSQDSYRLADPYSSLGPELRAMLTQSIGAMGSWAEPSDVRAFSDGDRLEYAGLGLDVWHAPGHTEGSAVFTVDRAADSLSVPGATMVERDAVSKTLISGDVLFRGSIGRTDLPGGSMEQMVTSLRDVVLPLGDEHLVLPGHGPATTMAVERRTNPYLMEVAASE